MIVGITIASMMPSALNRICRSAEAMGPCGLSTPSEQPASDAAPIKPTANIPYRISDLICLDVDGIVGGFRQRAAVLGGREPGAARGERDARGIAGVINEKCRKQDKQVKDGEHKQAFGRTPMGFATPVDLERKPNEHQPAERGDHAVDRPRKAECPG